MIRVVCDACGKDTSNESEAWAINMNEYVHNENTLLMHFCKGCFKTILTVFENAVKGVADAKAEADGAAEA